MAWDTVDRCRVLGIATTALYILPKTTGVGIAITPLGVCMVSSIYAQKIQVVLGKPIICNRIATAMLDIMVMLPGPTHFRFFLVK